MDYLNQQIDAHNDITEYKALADNFDKKLYHQFTTILNEIIQNDFSLYSRSLRGRFITLGFSYGFGKGEADRKSVV